MIFRREAKSETVRIIAIKLSHRISIQISNVEIGNVRLNSRYGKLESKLMQTDRRSADRQPFCIPPRSRRRLPESHIRTHTVSPEGLGAVSRASPENFRRCDVRTEGKHGDAKAIPNNSRDKPCETKPTDEKARESGQIACNCTVRRAFPAFSISSSRPPILPPSCYPLALSLSLYLSFVTSLLFLQSLTYRFLRREDQRSAVRETNDPRVSSFFFPFCFFLLEAKSFPRRARRRAPHRPR